MSEISEKEREVIIRLENDSDMVTVSVRDKGIGLAPDTVSQLFNPLYTSKRKGLGMGLAISRSIIEAHGGLWAKNNFDGGATIYFTVPMIRAN